MDNGGPIDKRSLSSITGKRNCTFDKENKFIVSHFCNTRTYNHLNCTGGKCDDIEDWKCKLSNHFSQSESSYEQMLMILIPLHYQNFNPPLLWS